MKKTAKRIIIPVSALILALMFAIPVLAQSPISATVDRTNLTTDDTLTLSVTVSSDGQPTLPSLTGFNLLGTGSSSQISIVNGSMNTQVVYNYHLQPIQPGQLTIDPVTLQVNGQSYTTPPISVQVTQGNGQPSARPSAGGRMSGLPPSLQQFFNNSGFGGLDPFSGADPFSRNSSDPGFVEAEVSNPNPYVGEQIVYTFRYYQPADDIFGRLDQPQFVPPGFTGFWTEGDSRQKQYQTQDSNGRRYSVTELKTVLIPTKVGEITIEPATLVAQGGFFSPGAELTAEPLTVNVQPLPDGAPVGFNGVVGQFEISATTEPTNTQVNEPVTWQVTLNGRGNIKTLADPLWPDLPNWRSFESAATVDSYVVEGQMVGSRRYERLLVPQVAGEFTIPALEFSYFNPTTGQYQTISSQPIPVSVAPGAGGSSTQAALPTLAPIDNSVTAAAQANGLRPLKPVNSLDQVAVPITNSALYWLAWLVPLVGLVGNFAWQRRQTFWANNADLARSSKAGRKARQAVAQAKKQHGDDVYSRAGQILTTYLAEKLNQPVLGLNQAGRSELLASKAVTAELIERINTCLNDAELGSYSPAAGNPAHADNLLNKIDLLIRDLETALK